MAERLTTFDASFLAIESPTAHMHVGWVAVLDPPENGERPSFEELRAHVESRIGRSQRYRQRLAPVPWGLHDAEWIEDPSFAIENHVFRAEGDLQAVVDEALSRPLNHDHPLWEIWIADELPDGRIGMVGKAHHCMADGVATVELGILLVDGTPDTPAPDLDRWRRPDRAPSSRELVRRSFDDRVAVARRLRAVLRAPRPLLSLPATARRAVRALRASLLPLAPPSWLGRRLSPARHLATFTRPVEELRQVAAHFGVTINDVVLSACAGGIGRFASSQGHAAQRLKAMVPVNVRQEDEGRDELGNRLSFIFMPLPCDEPDAVRRLRTVQAITTARKASGDPEGADAALTALGHAPRPIRLAVARLLTSPRIFNVTISNIPGIEMPLYMLGCRVRAAYPVVPLFEQHTVAVGVITIDDTTCFGIQADSEAVPQSDELAEYVDEALEELLELSREARSPVAGTA